MSIYRLDAVEYGHIDARYIQSVDLTITNAGAEEFDVLIHGYHLYGVYYVGLVHVGAGSTVFVPNITNHNTAFSLLLVTNINYTHSTLITVHAKNQGQLVAVYSNSDFQAIE
ncbi:hypothetical protein PVOR_15024 [Paenibacillus vortex V453]|jgi:hypothetical protein|uniref:Uncharacterized protein n=1 Tax=Paenibacillus vortex V453 TaxID=715225 RepID=A0A2R9SV56_9BACL|nr:MULTISPECIES: hypothetical protein [Paenibacillus]ANA82288.1 hypothetical protein A3958_20955 [Paenibacillus glucanolyticus]AVV58975.1 hypothetical protein C7121_24070 [Paenibacillus glucanolyticus]EFU41232.1 hypothetical protein PVOR_15024 [Paenibacillus vortex V453]ETT41716.1 hypothetical protein C169_06048 [Paenibacillus sp. FSL R5-808]MPY16521.1 hypothetical protein [Paenibacillus glucanolyticus]